MPYRASSLRVRPFTTGFAASSLYDFCIRLGQRRKRQDRHMHRCARRETWRVQADPESAPLAAHHSPVNSQFPRFVVEHPAEDLASYRNLREQEVNKARQLDFPQHRAFGMSETTRVLLGNIVTDPTAALPLLRVFGRNERDKMVGGANVNLLASGRKKWTSRQGPAIADSIGTKTI